MGGWRGGRGFRLGSWRLRGVRGARGCALRVMAGKGLGCKGFVGDGSVSFCGVFLDKIFDIGL